MIHKPTRRERRWLKGALSRDIFLLAGTWICLGRLNRRRAGPHVSLCCAQTGTPVYMIQALCVADLRYAPYHFDRSIYVVENEKDCHFEVLCKLMQ